MPGIEALRAMAAMAVVASHLWALTSHPTFPGYRFLYGLSLWAVDLFFLLSGFVLVQCFWGPRPQSLRQYYARRFLRIAPAYYVNIVILFLFLADRGVLLSDTGLRQVIANLTFTQWLNPETSTSLNVNGVFWTLSIEMTLYALMPLLAALISRRPVLAGASLFGLGIAYRIFVAIDPGPLQSWAFHSLPEQSDASMRLYLLRQFAGILPLFVLGMLLRWWLHFRPRRTPSVRLRWDLSLRRLAVILVPSVAVLAFVERAADYRQRLFFVGFDIALCLLIAPALLLAGQWTHAVVGRPMRALVWLGRRSYGIYLWHFPVILVVFERGPLTHEPDLTHIWLRVALVVLCSVALGAVSFALIERPASRAARRIAPPVACPDDGAPPAGRQTPSSASDALGTPAALTRQTRSG